MGQNQSGTTYYSSPVQIPGTTWSINRKGSGVGAAMAIKTDGTLWSWGRNDNGAGAQNNNVQYSSPVQVPGTTWEVVMSNQASAGLKV